MDSIKVLIADDHTLFRAGIKLLLDKIPGVSVVGEASNGHEAIKLTAKTQPDLILLDIAMPGLNGLEAIEQILKTSPQARVLILSMHASEDYALDALRAGASGYLIKDAAVNELEIAINACLKRECYLSPLITQKMVAKYKSLTGDTMSVKSILNYRIEPLTTRHKEILKLIAEGLSTKQIADRLAISIKTVDSHRTELMRRLNIHNVAGLVSYAIQTGLVLGEKLK